MAIAVLEAPALTIPQFRALHFIQLHAGASLSQTAEFLGLTLPSTSKLVDQLVKRGMLARNDHAQDRRRMTLRITPKGDALLKNAQTSVRKHLAGMLNRLDTTQLNSLLNTLTMLQESFPSHVGMSAEMHLGMEVAGAGSGTPSGGNGIQATATTS
jgi:DNA-binding MarR family transcriptional regulator